MRAGEMVGSHLPQIPERNELRTLGAGLVTLVVSCPNAPDVFQFQPFLPDPVTKMSMSKTRRTG